jgi:formyltetrahydrofolate deformylase
MNESAVLLLHSADRKELVATIANFLFSHGGNILHADSTRTQNWASSSCST